MSAVDTTPDAAPASPEALFAEVPPRAVLGAWSVLCCRCGVRLRPGQPRRVWRRSSGAWSCDVCPAPARVPAGGRTLEHLLSKSVEASR